MPPAKAAVLFLCAGSLAWHAAASRTRFRTIGRTPPRMKAIGASFAIAAMVNLVEIARADIGTGELVFALAFYATALGLFAWACAVNSRRPLTVAFSSDIPEHVVTSGPYRFMRHPFYAAYCLTWVAGAVASWSWNAALAAAVMVVQYVQAARLEEAKFAASPLAHGYREYRTTGWFRRMPVPPPLSRL
ncbi:MAG TPA: methyltransferase [Albitalea sp.]|nr:methyltransferase [Albitalea sp.]